MPDLNEQMYCSQQIHIPPMFPYILRTYAKAAIKTQPTDLLRWSCAYFRALSLNTQVPVKKRIEYPEPKNYMGLTPGFLKVLLSQVGKLPTIKLKYPHLLYLWDGICLKEDDLIRILLTGKMSDPDNIDWHKFIAVCAGYLTETLTETMILLCNLFTDEPDGGNAMISVDIFLNLYKFLAQLDCSKRRFAFNDTFLLQFRPAQLPLHEVKGASSTASRISTVPDEFRHLVPDTKPVPPNSSISAGFSSDKTDITSLKEEEFAIEDTPIVLELALNESDMKASQDEQEPSEQVTPPDDTSTAVISSEMETASEAKTVEGMVLNIDEINRFQASGHSVQIPPTPTPTGLHHAGFTEITPSFQTPAIKKVTPQYYLNKLLDSSHPSVVTDVVSSYTTALFPSETITIYKPSDDKAKEEREDDVRLQIKYEINELKGIGPVVDKKTMDYFIEFIKERAAAQHGMIMPRNITNFQCPPMENFNYVDNATAKKMQSETQFEGCENVY